MPEKVSSIDRILNINPNYYFHIDKDDNEHRITENFELQSKNAETGEWEQLEDYTIVDLMTGLIKIIE